LHEHGVISELLADDFQGTSTGGGALQQADELRDEKGPPQAHGCALDDARFNILRRRRGIIYGSEHAIGKDKTHPDAKVCPVWIDTWLKRDGKWQIGCRAGQQGRLQVAITRGNPTSSPPRCLDLGEHHLFHRHHRLEGALCLGATSRKRPH